MIKRETFIKIIIATAVAIVVAIVVSRLKEYFSDFNNKDFSYTKLDKSFFTSEKNIYKSNGAVYKYYYNGYYKYLYKFNIPIAIGGDYNTIQGEYIALIGKSKEDLKPANKLTRSSDGWYYLEFTSKDDYAYTQIVFNVPLDHKKSMVILEGNI